MAAIETYQQRTKQRVWESVSDTVYRWHMLPAISVRLTAGHFD
jgi:hypothetical protein